MKMHFVLYIMSSRLFVTLRIMIKEKPHAKCSVGVGPKPGGPNCPKAGVNTTRAHAETEVSVSRIYKFTT